MASSTAKTSKAFGLKGSRVRHLLAGALLLGSASLAADGFDEERKALARAKAQALVAEERAEKIESAAAAEQSEALAARAKAAAIAARIQATEADLSAAEARIRLIEKMREEQTVRLAQRQEPVARLMAALQMLSRRPAGLLLLQPKGSRDAVHMRVVLSDMIPEMHRRTDSLRKEIARAGELRADAQQAKGLLDTARQRLARQREEFRQIEAQHRAKADQLTGTALEEQDRAIGYGEQAKDIVALMNTLERNAEARDILARLPGPVLRPAKGETAPEADGNPLAPRERIPYRLPVSGALVAGLGDLSDTGVRSRGITLAPRAEAIVVAPSSGHVVFAGPFKGYGRIAIIDHGSGWTSLIANLEAIYVKVGDDLIQGSPLGRAGSGRPTITVELRHNNTPVDIAGLVG